MPCSAQVLALVGFRKSMDHCPSLFSQKELYWLDNLMPVSNKKEKKKKKGKEDATEIASKEVSFLLRKKYQNLPFRKRRVSPMEVGFDGEF